LPLSLRAFLRGPGATQVGGAGVLSYLLFEPGYCNELMELGYRDAMSRRDELCAFLGAQAPVSMPETADSLGAGCIVRITEGLVWVRAYRLTPWTLLRRP